MNAADGLQKIINTKFIKRLKKIQSTFLNNVINVCYYLFKTLLIF